MPTHDALLSGPRTNLSSPLIEVAFTQHEVRETRQILDETRRGEPRLSGSRGEMLRAEDDLEL